MAIDSAVNKTKSQTFFHIITEMVKETIKSMLSKDHQSDLNHTEALWSELKREIFMHKIKNIKEQKMFIGEETRIPYKCQQPCSHYWKMLLFSSRQVLQKY